MSNDANYNVGDEVNGHVLGDDNEWHEVQQKKPRSKLKIAGIAGGGLLALLVVGSALGGGTETEVATTGASATPTEAAASTSTPTPTPTPTPPPAPTPTPTPTPPPAPPAETVTTSQRNALRTAQDYLEYSAFSPSGLVGQLEYEGYSNADATWAVNELNADWSAEAVRMAEQYLEYSGFSRSGLIDQLVFEGFSYEQADAAASAVGL